MFDRSALPNMPDLFRKAVVVFISAILAFFIIASLLIAHSKAQSLTTIKSGTITAGGTFQIVFTGNCPNGVSDPVGCAGGPHTRNGCTIVNNSASNMFVWNSPITGSAPATDLTAITVPPDTAYYCQLVNGKTIQDPIYIDGTTAAAFYAGLQ